MSYSNPMHHAPGARKPVAPSAPIVESVERLTRERDALLHLIGRIHNNAAESPEWIRARIDETIVKLAVLRHHE